MNALARPTEGHVMHAEFAGPIVMLGFGSIGRGVPPLLTGGPGRGMIVNLSVDTSSADLMDLCKDIDAFYIDTVCEPWPGLYTNGSRSISERSNYALREGVLDVRRRRPGGVTAVSCCGANPGMVSWMVKQALIDVATELRIDFTEPT